MSGAETTTILQVLARFLDDQKARLAPRTFAQYRSAVELLQHSINTYGPNGLDKVNLKRWERASSAKGEAHREFCGLFGPEHILPNIDEFLGWFMVRKVMAGKDLLRAAGTMTKKLAKWLAEQGYVESEAVEHVVERGNAAGRDLPAARKLADLLDESAVGSSEDDEAEEGPFEIAKVERGRLWLVGDLDGREYGAIPVTDEASRRAKVGWTISGVLSRDGRKWRFAEVWNVHPR
jgi:hypothetical protein